MGAAQEIAALWRVATAADLVDVRDVGGRRAFWMRVTPLEGEMIEDHVFLESGDGRVLIVIMEAPRTLRAGFGPWFDAMLSTLQVHAIAPAAAAPPPPPPRR